MDLSFYDMLPKHPTGGLHAPAPSLACPRDYRSRQFIQPGWDRNGIS